MWLEVLSFLFGIAGLLVGVVSWVQARKADAEAKASREEVDRMKSLRRRLFWSDIQEAAQEAAKELSAKYSTIDAIIAPGPRGAIYAERLSYYLCKDYGISPAIIVGITRDKDDGQRPAFFKNWKVIPNSTWHVELPPEIKKLQGMNIAVVDDFARSGQFLYDCRKHLIEKVGLDRAQIATVVIVTKSGAREKQRVDHFWIEENDERFYFPWGKAL